MTRSLVLLALSLCALLSACKRENEASPAPRASVSAAEAKALPAAPVASAPAPRAAWQRPLLFKLQKGAQSFHVFGTIHVPDARLDRWPAELEAAFSQSEQVFTEIPMDAETQAAIVPLLTLPQGQRLGTLLPPDLHRETMQEFTNEGLPAEMFEPMKPWAVSLQLAILDHLLTIATKKPLDAVVAERAGAAGKSLAALETAEEQLRIFDSLTKTEQAALLRQALAYRKGARTAQRDPVKELLDAYVAGNEVELLRLIHESYDPGDALSRKLLKRVFHDRDATMTSRIASKVQAAPKKTLFFAVGAGHVIGESGIVARFAKLGFEAERAMP